MGETAQILALWRRARERGLSVCLATVVHIEGSSYRKRGARMLVTEGGERAGMISGGCLEGEISRKAWWLTASGASLQQYQSAFDDDSGAAAWGLGCGGTVWVLLERDPDASLEALAAAQEQGRPGVIAIRLGETPGTARVVSDRANATGSGAQAAQVRNLNGAGGDAPSEDGLGEALREAAVARTSLSLDSAMRPTDEVPAWVIEYVAPPPRLTIFGAGEDALPIARFAEELGWRVTVADGRAQLLRPERFTPGVQLLRLVYGSEEPAAPAGSFAPIPSVDTGVAPGELAVVLTHSWEQDLALMRALLPAQLAYLGVLGPRHRTARLLEQVAPALGWSVARCWRDLHAPVGLDLGAHDPASIALSIVAELQATVAARTVTVQPLAAAGAVHV